MTVGIYTYKLAAHVPFINQADTVIVAADSAANALELIQSHYPGVPAAAWAAVAAPTAETVAANYLGFRLTIEVTPAQAGRTAVSGKKYTFQYTGLTGETADNMATKIAAVMAAVEPFSGTTNAGSGVVTMAAADDVGDAAVASYVDYVADMAAYDANINPNALQNLVHLTSLKPTVQAVQANGATRTVTTIATTGVAPRVVGWFRDFTGASK
jgi:hypothetical protein